MSSFAFHMIVMHRVAGYHQWILPIAKLGGLGRTVGAFAFRHAIVFSFSVSFILYSTSLT